MRRWLVLAVALFCVRAPALPFFSCESGLAALVAPTFGDGPYDAKLGKRDPIRSDRHSDAFIIASGIGTVVVRKIPKDASKPSYCLKSYDDVFKFAIEAPGYRFLEELYPIGGEKPGTFEVVRVDFATVPGFVFMTDTLGRSLPEVVGDPRVDPKIRAAVETAYKDALADFDKRLESHKVTTRSAGEQDGLPKRGYSVERNGRQQQLSIRASQVVVSFDPNNPARFKLTLVDPF